MKTAVVICPGRGTYGKNELGYLTRHHAGRADFVSAFDVERASLGQDTLADLDGAKSYSIARHTRGDNASALIYTCSLLDFQAIDREAIEIVAVTGNSMGWYSALACAGALSATDGFRVVNTMGMLMQESLIGGQLIYPFVGDGWQNDAGRKGELLDLVAEIDAQPDKTLGLSIDLGGMLVLAGDEAGLAAFETAVPSVQGRFPLRLANHAAFHTALQKPVSQAGREKLAAGMFGQPALPLIDGRGAIWWPQAVDPTALWDYTTGHQVTEPYDFTRAIRTAAREFAPDLFIITGPGTTLGGAVAQSLILSQWKGMRSKDDFQARQQAEPLLASMDMAEQRTTVTNEGVTT